ncbi:30S ribosomal protein S13 [Methanotorris formicicus]|uniref:Small ribosomal subunit protein uS13 n=1 Tax=Methanotorris formicicus Mc-S-70 TaxID=647171 RepID=H1KY00_9EURY|nr:30S ribosomal protein S13 [Methanotorris formicicus]EHP87784.1 ribosomal protein S13P [Methanotorris formicicus Mc-S-70]
MTQEQTDFKYLIRISRTDIDGKKPLARALQEIYGIGEAITKAIIRVAKLDEKKLAGYLTDEEVKKIEEILSDPAKFGIPSWMFNRKKDYYTGEDKHIIESDLTIAIQEDINRLKKIRCYRGIRHELGLPCRGQRTKSTFRRGQTVGVSRRKK